MPLTDSQKGKIAEHLVGAACLLQSDGAFLASVPLVDDEGVDLILTHKKTNQTLLLQVKSRFTLSKRGNYRTQVRKAVLLPSPSKFLLFVFYDKVRAALGERMWLVPSLDFERLLQGQRAERPNFVFQSRFTSKADMWKPYQIGVQDLAAALLGHLTETRISNGYPF